MEMLLALDAGTTGVTGVIYDAEMRSLLRAYREFPQSLSRARLGGARCQRHLGSR